jgi:hypothetical protein
MGDRDGGDALVGEPAEHPLHRRPVVGQRLLELERRCRAELERDVGLPPEPADTAARRPPAGAARAIELDDLELEGGASAVEGENGAHTVPDSSARGPA